MRRGIFAAITFGAIAVPCAFGYNGETFTASGQTTQVTRPDAANLQFYLNTGVVAGATTTLAVGAVITSDSNPTAAIEAAMATWNNVGAASIHFNALQTTSTGHNSSDCLNVISIASSTADISVLGGATGPVAVTVNSFIESAGSVCGGSTSVPAGAIIDSDILLNPYYQFSTTSVANTKDVQAVITHEFGHVLGLNHSSLPGATMYPFTARFQRHLSWDEKAFAAEFYPSGKQTLGTISGTATVGGSPVKYGLITATDVSQGGGHMVCGLTAADGTYTVQAPAGTYVVSVEPFNSFIGPSNIYSLTTSTGVLDPTQVTTAFQGTFAGGNGSGTTPYTVTAGSSSTANITAISGASTLAVPFYGIGKAGANGDIQTFSSFGGAISVTGGTTFDLALAGVGIDSTIVLAYIGTNVTVGTSRVDPSGTLSISGASVPIIRTTITIGTQTNATLGSLWIVKGTQFIPLSGVLDIEPMTPGINSVQDAESASKTIVSGQYIAIYGSNFGNDSTRTWNPATDFTGGVAAGDPLPTSLDGVSVTVNGQPAAVYFTCAVCNPNQINAIVPSNLTSGPASVVVTNQGTATTSFSGATIGSASPSFFIYGAGGNYYPSAVHLSGQLVGDPAVQPGSAKAQPGELILMFGNGLGSSNGNAVATVTAFSGATVNVGSTAISAPAALLYAGEYQINVQLPSTLAAGNYPVTLNVPGGSSAGNGITVTLPVGP